MFLKILSFASKSSLRFSSEFSSSHFAENLGAPSLSGRVFRQPEAGAVIRELG